MDPSDAESPAQQGDDVLLAKSMVLQRRPQAGSRPGSRSSAHSSLVVEVDGGQQDMQHNAIQIGGGGVVEVSPSSVISPEPGGTLLLADANNGARGTQELYFGAGERRWSMVFSDGRRSSLREPSSLDSQRAMELDDLLGSAPPSPSPIRRDAGRRGQEPPGTPTPSPLAQSARSPPRLWPARSRPTHSLGAVSHASAASQASGTLDGPAATAAASLPRRGWRARLHGAALQLQGAWRCRRARRARDARLEEMVRALAEARARMTSRARLQQAVHRTQVVSVGLKMLRSSYRAQDAAQAQAQMAEARARVAAAHAEALAALLGGRAEDAWEAVAGAADARLAATPVLEPWLRQEWEQLVSARRDAGSLREEVVERGWTVREEAEGGAGECFGEGYFGAPGLRGACRTLPGEQADSMARAALLFSAKFYARDCSISYPKAPPPPSGLARPSTPAPLCGR